MVPEPHVTYTGAEVNAMRRALVYVLRNESGETLYVGCSAAGMCRPLYPKHHAIASIPDNDELQIFYCAGPKEALAMERDLIKKLHPSRNRWPFGREPHSPQPRLLRRLRPKPRKFIRRDKGRIGIREDSGGQQAYVRIFGKFYSKRFPPETAIEDMQKWRTQQRRNARKRARAQQRARVARALAS